MGQDYSKPPTEWTKKHILWCQLDCYARQCRGKGVEFETWGCPGQCLWCFLFINDDGTSRYEHGDDEDDDEEDAENEGDDEEDDGEAVEGDGEAAAKRSLDSTTCWPRHSPLASKDGADLRLSGFGMESAGYLSPQSSSTSALAGRKIDLQMPAGIILWVVAIMLVIGIALMIGGLWWRFETISTVKLRAMKRTKRKERQQRDLEVAAKRKARDISVGTATLAGSTD